MKSYENMEVLVAYIIVLPFDTFKSPPISNNHQYNYFKKLPVPFI